jgi:uncharacterized membrane protein YjjB (DUF3815 family)
MEGTLDAKMIIIGVAVIGVIIFILTKIPPKLIAFIALIGAYGGFLYWLLKRNMADG